MNLCECGGKLYITDTRHSGQGTLRKRMCQKCKSEVYSIEKQAEFDSEFQNIWFKSERKKQKRKAERKVYDRERALEISARKQERRKSKIVRAIIFSRNLKRIMSERDISCKVLAIDMKVPYSTVSNWRTGNYLPGPEIISRLAEYFSVAETELSEEVQ